MKHVALLGLFAALAAGGAVAQTAAPPVSLGLGAGDILVRVRAIGIIPQVSSSSVSLIGGHLDVTDTPAPEVDFSYFFTDHIAAELIAASTRHEIKAVGTALGDADVGSVWVLPPTLTVQYHFLPHQAFNPYLGAGVSAVFFYDPGPNQPLITKLGVRTAVGPAIQAGVDYNVDGRWFVNFDVKQIFIHTTAYLNSGVIKAKTDLNPTVIGAGIGYRF